MEFDWHGGMITRATKIDAGYRNTQNIRRFLTSQCGADFRFDRDLMKWIRSGLATTVGDIVDEWKRRHVRP